MERSMLKNKGSEEAMYFNIFCREKKLGQAKYCIIS